MNKIIVFSFCLVLSACSYSTFYVPAERLVYQASEPGTVAISTQESVKQPYKVLGTVAAITWGDAESAREHLQVEAAHLGANLIIRFRIERGFWRSSASGLAVLVYPKE